MRPGLSTTLKQVEQEGIPVEVFALEASRASVVARLKGSGAKTAAPADGTHRHGDRRCDEVDASAVGAVRGGGYIYGRGAVDDKDDLVANLMTIILLKRMNVRSTAT